MADNAYTKLPLPGQLGVSFGIALLIGGLFWYLYWSDTVVERDDKTAKLEALNKEIRALEVTAQKLGEFQREVALLEKKLETLKTILPPAKETPDLMRKVQALAAQSNLTINNFTPGPTVNKEFYQEWPITMGLVGNYHNLALFFDKVSRLPRLVNVGNLKINSLGAQTASNTIGVGSTATTFVYVETPPAGAKACGGAMRSAAMKGTLIGLALVMGATTAFAQEPSPGASPSPASTDIVKSRIDQEIAAAPGSYSYTAQGRRDPFVSLLRPVSESGPGKRRPGMEGFLIQEVALKGIVKDSKGYTAMLLGTDNKSYFVKVGQRLFDGVITAIDASTVTFRQEVTDPLSSVRSRDVKKTLYPSEEGRQ